MRQAGARGGGKDGNFTSEARAHPQPVAAPFFHNFTPGFQLVPPLLWLKDPGVKEAFRKVESRMVLGRGQGTSGGEGRGEVMAAGPLWAGMLATEGIYSAAPDFCSRWVQMGKGHF